MPVRELARRVAAVEALDAHAGPLAGQHALGERLPQRLRLVDLAAAENAAVAGRERLGDRRRGPQDVHDEPGRRLGGLGGSEGDVDAHGARDVTAPGYDPARCQNR